MFTCSIDPVAITIGSLSVRWYGLMYVVGFLLGWLLGRRRAARFGWEARDVDDLVTISMLGCVLGGRVGYILFYDLPLYLNNPMEIVRFWNGGMSFHGAAIGLSLAFAYYARTRKRTFIDIADFITPLIPQGLLFGRIGNFINAELWGKVTTAPWGVIFPGAGPYPRHPSQLYEALLEGVLLWIVLFWFSATPRRRGQIAGLFAMWYAVSRFLVEFVRLPDAQLGYLAFNWLTMGQVLSLPLFAVGFWLFFASHEKSASGRGA
ncbi:MAG: prolipoprotein diacylglyceryl transferase [Desulfovibrionaceae bacterium]|nr:prolipoprotein diacylglyceryl transferase [Desulfovibrionaceae bacterium]